MNHEPVTTPSPSTESRGSAVPIWLIIVMSLLLYSGALYFDQYGGWFSPQVYAPYRSVEDLARFQPRSDGPDLARGKQMYDLVCALCHGNEGEGKPNQAPPLAGSEWVLGNPNRLIRIPLYGLNGPITVKGQLWTNPTSMPAMGAALSAEDVAAILTYMRNSWGNKAEPITAEQVEAVKQAAGARAPFTPAELETVQ